MDAKTVCLIERHDVFRFDGETLHTEDLKKCKKDYISTLLPPDILRSHTFKLPLSTSEEKLRTLVEIRMYEEGGLDVETEYAIDFVKHPLEFDDSYLIEAYAVEVEKLQALYKEMASKIGHIDLAAVPYFIYEGFYTFELFDDKKVDLFLRFGVEGCYVVLCKEGHTIAVRNLPGVEGVALKAKVTPEVLLEALAEKGLEENLYAPDERLVYAAIAKWMADVVERVAQTVNHKRGIFALTGVDAVHLDFEGGEIPGLWALMDGYGFAQSRKGLLICCEKVEANRRHTAVAGLYALAAAEGKLTPLNLTVFEKKPPLWSSHVGKMLVGMGIAAALTLAAGGYLQWQLDRLDAKASNLQSRYAQIKARTKNLHKKLMALKKERKDLQNRLAQHRRTIDTYDEAVDVMALIIDSKKRRWQMFKDVDLALQRYNLMATSMEQNGSKSMAVEVLTPFEERENIAKFMKRLIEKGYRSVRTERIQLDKNLYRSRVEITR